MKFKITGKNLEVSDSLRDAVTDKLGKLDKYFSPDTRVIVTLSLEKGRQKVEVTIPVKGSIIRSEQISSDMYVSIDLADEVLERQIRTYTSKIVSRNQSAGDLGRAFLEEESDEEGTIRIVRTKRFDIKPMYAEDACIQMDLLGHSFFVFNNAETDEVNVVYKRKDGSFGLIEPEN